MKRNDVTYLIGGEVQPMVSEPYSETAVEFLNELSMKLLKFKDFSDIVSLAFYCRRANIMRLKEQFKDNKSRLGRGTVFHVSPSNVPINFAFSFVFGLLAGCGNIVRVPSKNFKQTAIVCECIKELFQKPAYARLAESTAFVSYPRSDEITAHFSELSSCRIIWGGDQTVNTIRKIQRNPKSIDISFTDRYSFAVIGSDDVMNAEKNTLNELAKNFYNDTFFIDQNACSSPHLIVWTGDVKNEAKQKFWDTVFLQAKQQYAIEPIKVMDKYDSLLNAAIDNDNIGEIKRMENLIYRISLKSLSGDIDCFRGKFGMFYEYDCDDLQEIASIVTPKFQTITYYGELKDKLLRLVTDNKLSGIDRIVPIGQALQMDAVWDGFDVVKTLTRIITAV